MYCAQPSSTQTSHWAPAFPSNASAHIPHLRSAQCFSKQYLCPPHSLSFPLPSAWLPLPFFVSLLSFFAAHSSFPLPRCSANLSIPSPPTLYQCRRHSLQGTGQEKFVSDNHVHTRLSNRSPTVWGQKSQHKMVWSFWILSYVQRSAIWWLKGHGEKQPLSSSLAKQCHCPHPTRPPFPCACRVRFPQPTSASTILVSHIASQNAPPGDGPAGNRYPTVTQLPPGTCPSKVLKKHGEFRDFGYLWHALPPDPP